MTNCDPKFTFVISLLVFNSQVLEFELAVEKCTKDQQPVYHTVCQFWIVSS